MAEIDLEDGPECVPRLLIFLRDYRIFRIDSSKFKNFNKKLGNNLDFFLFVFLYFWGLYALGVGGINWKLNFDSIPPSFIKIGINMTCFRTIFRFS